MLKRALVVFGHPNPQSYGGSLRDITLKKLASMNYEVAESDLYRMKFKPVITPDDYKAEKHKEDVNISDGLKKTVEKNETEPEIKQELDKVFAANYIIFIAPTWWGTFPAIVKGWLDRVLLKGAVFDVPDDIFKNGYLKGKKVLLVTSTGWGKGFFAKEGEIAGGQTIQENYWHVIEGAFAFCGMETLPIYPIYGLDSLKEAELKKTLDDFEKMLGNIENLKPIHCPLLHD